MRGGGGGAPGGGNSKSKVPKAEAQALSWWKTKEARMGSRREAGEQTGDGRRETPGSHAEPYNTQKDLGSSLSESGSQS